jgi:hypothetical protein
MATIAELRAQNPGAYDDMSDKQLADALYAKHYSDMPRAEFDKKVGMAPAKPQSFMDRAVEAADSVAHGLQNLTGKYGRTAMQTGGMIAGGVLAAPAAAAMAIPSGGVGAAAAETEGVGLGSALGGHYYDTARDYFTGSKSPPLNDQAHTALQDFSAGASLVPGAKLVGGATSKLLPMVMPAVRTAGQRIASVLDAGATPAAENVRSAALAKVLAQQESGAQAAAKAEAGKAASNEARAAMDAVVAKKAEQGIAPSDTPEAQQLVATLRAKQNPNGPVATIPTADQSKVYQQIIDTLSPDSGPKPSLETIQNLRRQIAKPAFQGEVSGAAAIDKLERRDLVKALNSVEDAYTGGTSVPVRENWAQALEWTKRAKAIDKLAPDLQAAAAKLEMLSPKDSAATARQIVDKLAKKGLVQDQEYRDFLQLADAATTAQGKAAFRKKIAMYGAIGLGLGEGAKLGLHALP